MTCALIAGHAFENTRERTSTDRLSVVLMPYRIVTCFLLASLLWKSLFIPGIFTGYLDLKLSNPFFPEFFSGPRTLAVLYLTPVTIGLASLFVRNQLALRCQAVTRLTCLFGLCIYQGTYNDVTFVTCFWVAAWCVWYSFRLGDPADILLAKAKVFGILII